MELIQYIDKIEKPLKDTVVTIGNFDGVHKGHQLLFKKVIQEAEKIKGTSVVITFYPHPLKIFGKTGPPLITRKDQKTELISKSGVDKLIIISFTKEFASISAHDFVYNFLLKEVGMKAIVVGGDYSFGKGKEGNIELLKELSKQEDFKLIVPDLVQKSETQKEKISSTMIRQLVMDGKVDQVQPFLGRHYQIRGKVIQGRERGANQLGFPTANIKLHDELCPKMGVYAVSVETVFGHFNGVANIGYSPTFDDHLFTIEVHILDFSENLYNTRIRVNMIKHLRDEKKFANIKELSAQINLDIDKAKSILSTTPELKTSGFSC